MADNMSDEPDAATSQSSPSSQTPQAAAMQSASASAQSRSSAAPQSETSPQDPAALMAWLENRIQECNNLIREHTMKAGTLGSDGYLDSNLEAQLHEARVEFYGELEYLKSTFPDVVPDHQAPQFEHLTKTGKIPDRSSEIDPMSEDPRHLDFSLMLLRWAYQSYREYCGPDVVVSQLREEIDANEEYLKELIEEPMPTPGGEQVMKRILFKDWHGFDRQMSRSYHQQQTHDFIHQVARDSVHVHDDLAAPDRISRIIACLANHDFSNSFDAQLISTFTGRGNILDGAVLWLESLEGPGLHYQLALPDIDPREYWFDLWKDLRQDFKQPTYEKVFVGVKLILNRPEVIFPSINCYVRLVMDDLMCMDGDDPLSEAQALVLARLVQLSALIDRNDPGNLKVERDIVNSVKCMVDADKTSNFVLMEHVEALRTRAIFSGRPGFWECPRPLSRHAGRYPRVVDFDSTRFEFFAVNFQGDKMVLIRRSNRHKRWLVPANELTIMYQKFAVGQVTPRFQFQINPKIDSLGEEGFETEWFSNVGSTVAELEASLPGVKVDLQSL